jgi:hypothetical protein
MKHDKYFMQCYKQLALEGILRSSLLGISIGLFAGVIHFIIASIIVQDLFALAIVISALISVLSSLLLYLFKYRPNQQMVAKRIDRLGLEERAITMVELEKNQSYIAQVQREDASHILMKTRLRLLSHRVFIKPILILMVVCMVLIASWTVMTNTLKAAENVDPPIDEVNPDDRIFQEMIDKILVIISNAEISITLKGVLYGKVVDLERRIPLYSTYIEKYQDVLQTRNEILQLIADAVKELEQSLMNIAQALQQYENTEVLGLAIATWNDDEIIAAFDFMYDRIAILLGQELYDVMWQTAMDIEAALAEAVGTDPGMHEALQELADAYKLALDGFEIGEEAEMLTEFKGAMDQSLTSLLEAIQALRDLIERLLELQDEIEEAVDEVDQFPIFMPYPDEGGEGTDPGDPNVTSKNTVIDGTTPYEDVYDSFYAQAMQWLTSEQISEEMRKFIQNYFDMLATNTQK